MNARPNRDQPRPNAPPGPEPEGLGVVAVVYEELRGLAAHYLRGERPNHTLRPTELVHEAFLRLAKRGDAPPDRPEQFFALAARAMRHVLVDHARKRGAAKRGGGRTALPLDELRELSVEQDQLLIEVDDALARLAALEPRLSEVVELRFFGGLTVEETARATGASPKTVQRRWTLARSWLHREIARG